MKSYFKIGLWVLVFLNSLFFYSQTNGLDANGKKHGLWKGIYEKSKRPRYEGNFEHGKETGVFKFFDDTKAGSVIATRDFNAKTNEAYTTFYDQKKNKVSEGNTVNKLKEGLWKYYHSESDKIMTTEYYKLGKLDGLRSVFYLNGKLAEEAQYANDIKEGIYKKYAENGVVLEESVYTNGEYNGLATFKDGDGALVSKGRFTKGKKTGIWQFYEKGKLSKEINMSKPPKIIKKK